MKRLNLAAAQGPRLTEVRARLQPRVYPARANDLVGIR